MLLGHGATEALHQPQRATQHPHVGGAGGRQCSQPAQPGHAHGIPQGHEQHRIGHAVRHFVVERAGGRLATAFDGDHAIDEIAQQAQLDAHGTGNGPPTDGADQQADSPQRRKHDAGHRDAVGRDAGLGHSTRQPLDERVAACLDGAAVGFSGIHARGCRLQAGGGMEHASGMADLAGGGFARERLFVGHGRYRSMRTDRLCPRAYRR